MTVLPYGDCAQLSKSPLIAEARQRPQQNLSGVCEHWLTNPVADPTAGTKCSRLSVELQALSGNSLVKSVVERQADIKANIKEWQQTTKHIGERLPLWDNLSTPYGSCEGLAVLETVSEQYDAIKERRSLLADPGPGASAGERDPQWFAGCTEKPVLNMYQRLKNLCSKKLKSDGLWKRLKSLSRKNCLKQIISSLFHRGNGYG